MPNMCIIISMDIRQSDLGLLLALDTLLAERNVTRAAERMNISQPALSAQLARLRDLFEDQLLVPSGRQMVPTARAMALEERLHKALEELAQLVREQQPFEAATSTRTFRIIAPDYLHTTITLPMISAAQAVAPNIRLALLPFDPATTWSLIENLEADLLLAWTEVTPHEARAKPIYTEQLAFIQRKGHPRGGKKLTLDALCKLDHISISPQGGTFHGPLDDELEKLGKSRNVVASVPSFLAAPPLVAQSNLVATIPRRLAQITKEEIEIFDLPLPTPEFDVLASWHVRLQNDPGHKWLRDLAVAPPATM